MSPERDKNQISFEEIASKATEIMLRDGYHMPTLIVDGGKKLVTGQIPDLPETYGERVDLMRFLGQAAAKSGRVGQLQQVFMISEGWMSVADEGKLAEVRPSRDPKRKEVLLISRTQVKEDKKQIRVYEILRDTDKRVVRLQEFLPDDQKRNKSAEMPLLDAFVQGFQTAFRTKYN